MSEPQVKKTKTVSTLDQLKAMTTIVADTGDFEGMPVSYYRFKLSLFLISNEFLAKF